MPSETWALDHVTVWRRAIGSENELPNSATSAVGRYLNNVVEQDHRTIK